MSNSDHTSDLRAAELVSNHSTVLWTRPKKKALNESMSTSTQLQSFNEISTLIQQSVADAAAKTLAGDDLDGTWVDGRRKNRLRKSIDSAKSESLHFRDATIAQSAATTEPHEMVRRSHSQFRLLRQIGSGGLGSVWLAYDENIKRKVAIKFLTKDGYAVPQGVATVSSRSGSNRLAGTSQRSPPVSVWYGPFLRRAVLCDAVCRKTDVSRCDR